MRRGSFAGGKVEVPEGRARVETTAAVASDVEDQALDVPQRIQSLIERDFQPLPDPPHLEVADPVFQPNPLHVGSAILDPLPGYREPRNVPAPALGGQIHGPLPTLDILQLERHLRASLRLPEEASCRVIPEIALAGVADISPLPCHPATHRLRRRDAVDRQYRHPRPYPGFPRGGGGTGRVDHRTIAVVDQAGQPRVPLRQAGRWRSCAPLVHIGVTVLQSRHPLLDQQAERLFRLDCVNAGLELATDLGPVDPLEREVWIDPPQVLVQVAKRLDVSLAHLGASGTEGRRRPAGQLLVDRPGGLGPRGVVAAQVLVQEPHRLVGLVLQSPGDPPDHLPSDQLRCPVDDGQFDEPTDHVVLASFRQRGQPLIDGRSSESRGSGSFVRPSRMSTDALVKGRPSSSTLNRPRSRAPGGCSRIALSLARSDGRRRRTSRP